jgi:hypothetical protein
MKKSILGIAFFALFFVAQPAQAQWAYGLSDLGADYQNSVVYGLTYVEEDYYSYLYADTYVEGYTFENGTQVDGLASFGANIAYVITDAAGHGGSTYTQGSKHWLVAYYFDPVLGWLDFWGFSTYGGNYGYSFTWGDRPTTYYVIQFLFLGATIAEGIFDENPLASVKLDSVTPAGPIQVTPGTSVTFTAKVVTENGNAMGNVAVIASVESNPNQLPVAPPSETQTKMLADGIANFTFTFTSVANRFGPVKYRFGLNSAPAGVSTAGDPINVDVCYGIVGDDGVCDNK